MENNVKNNLLNTEDELVLTNETNEIAEAETTSATPTVGTRTVPDISEEVAIDSITLFPSAPTIMFNGKITLVPTILPANATNQALQWTSDNPLVADVDQNGVVTSCSYTSDMEAHLPLSATIYATATDGSNAYRECTVRVDNITPITSIAFESSQKVLKIGDTFSPVAEVLPSDATVKTLTWESSNSNVLSVDRETGAVTALASGMATVYARAQDGSEKYGSCAVTVISVPVTNIAVTPSQATVKIGETVPLAATVSPSDATIKTVYWESSNPSALSVNYKTGAITGLSTGGATVYARAQDGSDKYGACAVEVVRVPVTAVTVTPDTKTINVGERFFLTATVSPSDATVKTVTWESSNKTVLDVNRETGAVTALAVGTATITAVAKDESGKSGSCTVTVLPIPVESLTLDRSTAEVTVGDASFALIARITPETATNQKIKWSSNAPSIVAVDAETGVMRFLSAGTATVTATLVDDGTKFTAACVVTVKQTVTKPTEEKPENTAPENPVADPVDASTGAHVIRNVLLSLYGGQGLKLVANYDSAKLADGLLGRGWYYNYEKRLDQPEEEIYAYSSPSSYARYVADNEECTTYTCITPGKNGYVLTVTSDAEYPYVITCNANGMEYYDTNGMLAKVVDHQGFETLITYDGDIISVKDTVSGKSLHLEVGSTGLIYKIYDDAEREVLLTYTDDLLTGICDANGHTLTYTYDEEGRVLTGTDAKGICYFRNTYDGCGRIIEQRDAIDGSLPTKFVYEGRKRTVTDRNGNVSLREYDTNGMLIRFTDANGNTKSYTYDKNYNVTAEADAQGGTVTRVFNAFNKPEQITDQNGEITYFSYDAFGNVIVKVHPMKDDMIPCENFEYNDRNQLTKYTDLRRTETVYTYDANGMPLTKKVGDKTAEQFSYENGLLKSHTDALSNTTSYAYNALGQLASKTDADENVTTYTYDACGNLLTVTDANEKSITYTYDANHQKTSFTDARGNKTEYSYNGNMKNDRISYPDGSTVRYEYDGEDRVISSIDPAGNATTFKYDKGGRMIAEHFPDGASVCYEYDAVGNVVKETRDTGATVTKTYDKVGQLLSVKDHEGNVSRYQYSAMRKLKRKTNALSGASTYVYSEAGDVLSETDALGNVKTYTYDAFGNCLTATDARGNTTTYTYDACNRLLSVKDPLGNTTSYAYNARGLCASVTDALGNTVRYGYDALGRRTTVTDARGNTFTTDYDANGNVIKTTDAKGNTVSETVYNSMNLPVSVTDAQGKTTSYTYTALGKVESVTDPMQNTQKYTYDARGRNTAVRDAAGHMSRMDYDRLGNVTRIAGPLGGSTDYTYDDMGRLTSESTVSGGVISYTYNALNVKDEIVSARGCKKNILYDALGRVTGYSTEEDAVRYSYDACGNVLTVTDQNGTVTREYDACNRVTSYTDTYGNVIRYTYDAVGNLTKMVYPAYFSEIVSVHYTYDENRNLLTVTDWANRVTSYTYDENNRVVGVTKPDGSVTTTVYDNKQRVSSTVEKTASGAVISGFTYTYDALSRVVEENVLANSTKMCYTYDEAGRVLSRTVKDASDVVLREEHFTYDAAGNILGAPGRHNTYDKNNRLLSYEGKELVYDLDGNLLSDGEKEYEYDSQNRLLSVDGERYVYNAENLRVVKHSNDGETVYVHDTSRKLSRLLQKTIDFNVTRYIYGRGLIGEEYNGTFKTYHFDSRGSTVAITNESGVITDTFTYDTYGKQIARTGTNEVLFGYNGRDGVLTDESGLLYMRARYYSPTLRRFINADILAGQIANSPTLNRYAYANGNPVSFVDPFGLAAERGAWQEFVSVIDIDVEQLLTDIEGITLGDVAQTLLINEDALGAVHAVFKDVIETAKRPKGMGKREWERLTADASKQIDDLYGPTSKLAKGLKALPYISVGIDVLWGGYENYQNGEDAQEIVTDIVVDASFGITTTFISSVVASAAAGAVAGSVAPGVGNAIGLVAGAATGAVSYIATEVIEIDGKSLKEWADEKIDWLADTIVGWFD